MEELRNFERSTILNNNLTLEANINQREKYRIEAVKILIDGHIKLLDNFIKHIKS
jgi:hypothetical protein